MQGQPGSLRFQLRVTRAGLDGGEGYDALSVIEEEELIPGFDFDKGFREYASATASDYAEVLRKGLVVVDTNVLLDLYRYQAYTREDLLATMTALGERLFIPHQVATEFWRGREGAVREGLGVSADLARDLDRNADVAAQALSTWANRAGVPPDQLEPLQSSLRRAYAKVSEKVADRGNDELTLAALNTYSDPVLSALHNLLRGKVGPPFDPDQQAVHEREAQRRVENQEPPGYKDKSKTGTASWGDYFVWRQLLNEAATRACDVLLVTRDSKEDWWRREHNQTRGPRLELSAECLRETGHQLLMLTPSNLLSRAKDALDVRIRKGSVESANRIDRYAYDRERRNYYATSQLSPLVKLPEGPGGYVQTLVDMTALAAAASTYDDFIESFRDAFPFITLADEARRRVSILSKLDLVNMQEGRVELTKQGQRLLAEDPLVVLQEQFMRRVGGAVEIRDLAATTPLTELRRQLREEPPAGVSPTQASLVLRYMEQLELL